MAQSRRDDSAYSEYLESKLHRAIETSAALSARMEQLKGRVEGLEESFRSVARLVKLQQNFLETQHMPVRRDETEGLESRVRKLEELYSVGREEDRRSNEMALRAVQDQVESILRLWNTQVGERLDSLQDLSTDKQTAHKTENIDIRLLIEDLNMTKSHVERLDADLASLLKQRRNPSSDDGNDIRLARIEDILVSAVERMSTIERRTTQDRNEMEKVISQRFSHSIDRISEAIRLYSEEQRDLQSAVNELRGSKEAGRRSRSKSALGEITARRSSSKAWTPDNSSRRKRSSPSKTERPKSRRQKSLRKTEEEK